MKVTFTTLSLGRRSRATSNRIRQELIEAADLEGLLVEVRGARGELKLVLRMDTDAPLTNRQRGDVEKLAIAMLHAVEAQLAA